MEDYPHNGELIKVCWIQIHREDKTVRENLCK